MKSIRFLDKVDITFDAEKFYFKMMYVNEFDMTDFISLRLAFLNVKAIIEYEFEKRLYTPLTIFTIDKDYMITITKHSSSKCDWLLFNVVSLNKPKNLETLVMGFNEKEWFIFRKMLTFLIKDKVK